MSKDDKIAINNELGEIAVVMKSVEKAIRLIPTTHANVGIILDIVRLLRKVVLSGNTISNTIRNSIN